MPSPEEILKGHPFFAGIPDQYLTWMATVAKQIEIDPNRFLFRQGTDADCFLVLHQGEVAIELRVGGRGARIIQTVQAGEVIGWSWLQPPYRWMYDGRALTQVECLCLDRVKVLEHMDDDHEFGYEILSRFSEVIIEALNRTRIQLLDVYGNGY